jgi:uncharacterized membrane protein/PAS domain-containing protein
LGQTYTEARKNNFISLLASSSPYLLELFLDYFHEAIVVMTTDYTVLFANNAFMEVYGLAGMNKQSFIGRKCYHILRGADKPCDDIACPVREVLKTRSIEIVDQERCLPIGEKARIMQIAVPLFDENKEIKYILKVVRRSPPDKKIEIQEIFDYVDQPIVLLDHARRIKGANAAFTKMVINIHGAYPRSMQVMSFDPEKALRGVTEVKLKLDGVCMKLRATASRLIVSGEELFMLVISGLSREVDQTLSSLSLENGYLYYVIEKEFEITGAIAQKLAGLLGCATIVRSPNTEFLSAAHCDLLELGTSGKVKPSINDILSKAAEFLSRGRILFLEGLSYLLQTLGDEGVEKLIIELRELAKTMEGIIMISVQPEELKPMLNTVLVREARHYRPSGLPLPLTPSEKAVMEVICRGQGRKLLYQSEIISRTGLSKPTVSKVLKELENKGLVRLIRKGKLKYVEPTEQGISYCFP